MHIIKPELFVPWDSVIKQFYSCKADQVDNKKTDPDEQYLYFLKKMQECAKALIQQNHNFIDELNYKIKKLYEGNLEQARHVAETLHKRKSAEGNMNSEDQKESNKEDNITKYAKMVEFMENSGKTMAKYLDEYNWITITNNVKILPEWHPE